MFQFAVAKILLLISSGLFIQIAFGEGEIIPNLECGRYRVQGKLILNKHDYFVISIRHSTASPFELILFGGDVDSKLLARNRKISAEVYIPQAVSTQHFPVSHLKSIGSFNKDKPWYQKIKKEKCGLTSDKN